MFFFFSLCWHVGQGLIIVSGWALAMRWSVLRGSEDKALTFASVFLSVPRPFLSAGRDVAGMS